MPVDMPVDELAQRAHERAEAYSRGADPRAIYYDSQEDYPAARSAAWARGATSDDAETLALHVTVLAWAAYGIGLHQASAGYAGELRTLGERMGDPKHQARGLSLMAILECRHGLGDEIGQSPRPGFAAAYADRAMQVLRARTPSTRQEFAQATAVLVQAQAALGDTDSVQWTLRQATDAMDDLGGSRKAGCFAWLPEQSANGIGAAFARLGHASAPRMIQNVIDTYPANAHHLIRCARFNLAYAHARTGDYREAVDVGRKTLEDARPLVNGFRTNAVPKIYQARARWVAEQIPQSYQDVNSTAEDFCHIAKWGYRRDGKR